MPAPPRIEQQEEDSHLPFRRSIFARRANLWASLFASASCIFICHSPYLFFHICDFLFQPRQILNTHSRWGNIPHLRDIRLPFVIFQTVPSTVINNPRQSGSTFIATSHQKLTDIKGWNKTKKKQPKSTENSGNNIWSAVWVYIVVLMNGRKRRRKEIFFLFLFFIVLLDLGELTGNYHKTWVTWSVLCADLAQLFIVYGLCVALDDWLGMDVCRRCGLEFVFRTDMLLLTLAAQET